MLLTKCKNIQLIFQTKAEIRAWSEKLFCVQLSATPQQHFRARRAPCDSWPCRSRPCQSRVVFCQPYNRIRTNRSFISDVMQITRQWVGDQSLCGWKQDEWRALFSLLFSRLKGLTNDSKQSFEGGSVTVDEPKSLVDSSKRLTDLKDLKIDGTSSWSDKISKLSPCTIKRVQSNMKATLHSNLLWPQLWMRMHVWNESNF